MLRSRPPSSTCLLSILRNGAARCGQTTTHDEGSHHGTTFCSEQMQYVLLSLADLYAHFGYEAQARLVRARHRRPAHLVLFRAA